MSDPTRVHAYLARIKDQEKDVIAVPDGAGRALCVSSDKHWTLTREWDELHIIAPLVEDEGNDDELERLRKSLAGSRDAHQRTVQAHETMKRAFDLSQERVLELKRERDEWKTRTTGFGKHENTTALAVDDRDIEAVKVEAVNDGKWWIADGTLINTCEFPNADEARDAADEYLELAKGAEAVARAIEAGQDVDPVEAKARDLWEATREGGAPVAAWADAHEDAQAQFRVLARHVLGQEDRHVDQ